MSVVYNLLIYHVQFASIGAVWQENSLCLIFLSEGSDRINGAVRFPCISNRYPDTGVSVGNSLNTYTLSTETDTAAKKGEMIYGL